MPASSNFNQAIRDAQTSSIVGPNVVQKALPYVGGGMVLTSLGVLAGVSLIATNPSLFQPLSIVALIAPQKEWPRTTMSFVPNFSSANSMLPI